MVTSSFPSTPSITLAFLLSDQLTVLRAHQPVFTARPGAAQCCSFPRRPQPFMSMETAGSLQDRTQAHRPACSYLHIDLPSLCFPFPTHILVDKHTEADIKGKIKTGSPSVGLLWSWGALLSTSPQSPDSIHPCLMSSWSRS